MDAVENDIIECVIDRKEGTLSYATIRMGLRFEHGVAY